MSPNRIRLRLARGTDFALDVDFRLDAGRLLYLPANFLENVREHLTIIDAGFHVAFVGLQKPVHRLLEQR